MRRKTKPKPKPKRVKVKCTPPRSTPHTSPPLSSIPPPEPPLAPVSRQDVGDADMGAARGAHDGFASRSDR
jgi:hypothetical protein